jgi:hypothetical protein
VLDAISVSVDAKSFPKAEYMTIAIANREFLHLISFLNQGTVNYIGALRFKLSVQSCNVAYPEEGIPRSSLSFIGYDEGGRRHSAQHNRETIATTDGKLQRRARRVFTSKTQYLLIERD